MTDCGANHIPQIPELGCHAKPRSMDHTDDRPLLLVSVVVKVMARLYYGSAGNHPSSMDSTLDESTTSSIDGTNTYTTTTTTGMNPRIYQELFDLRLLVVTLILKSPARNSRALTVVIMQALLLVNRIVTSNESQHSIQGLPASLKSPRALFLACLTLSEACLMDSQTSTRTWSKVSCLPPGEIAKLKNGALAHLEFKVHVNGEEFGWWCKVVMDWMQLVNQQQLF
ncbi:hypothetical protein CcCBS67573_g07770 [Chytriomyces confervae]|uniref:Cyclin N-terminal domain-containing protein n=1 Tax=Chytriomyces confervae TaxID=246404 RepID=A0A507EQV0_9FUNG|nr:hypothetical protein CcCBS67573_g07770 [Chytriomyces confervae]